MEYTTIIGLEVHVQLFTKTKLFCGCPNKFNPDNPNTQTCPVCLGLPGALPVLNEHAFHLGMKTALALNCEISPFTKWDRKQYYYPDLPKAYQISQFDLPFSHEGWVEIPVNGDPESEEIRRVGIIRAHLEEDAGKNIHDESGGKGDSKVDLNRCGTPLVEIVTEPDLRSPAEARRFLEELRLLLTYLEVSDCNMQEGSLRCDANVNLKIHSDDGQLIPTPIVEIKNLNSFSNVEAACEFEIKRQLKAWEETGISMHDPEGGKVTVGWNPTANKNRGGTFEQRGKEDAADYRYFPDPDLVPVTVKEATVEEVRENLVEFPADRRSRFQITYQLSLYDATVIIDRGREFADYYEIVATACLDGKTAANWVTQDVLREMHEREQTIDQFLIPAEVLGALLKKVTADELTIKSAKEVFTVLLADAEMGSHLEADRIDRIVEERGLGLVTDTGEMEQVIEQVIAKNQKSVDDFKSGKQAAIGPLIGQVMRQLKGADPKTVRELLIARLES